MYKENEESFGQAMVVAGAGVVALLTCGVWFPILKVGLCALAGLLAVLAIPAMMILVPAFLIGFIVATVRG